MFPNTCCVLRITMMSIAISCRRGTKNQKQITFIYPVVVAISSFQPTMKSLNNQGIPQLLGKSCFLHTWQYHYQSEAANLTGCSGQRQQFVLPWFETFVAEGYSALSERKRNTKLQELTLGLERWQTQMDRVEAVHRAAEIGISWEKKKEEKLVDTDRKLYSKLE